LHLFRNDESSTQNVTVSAQKKAAPGKGGFEWGW